MTEHRPDTDDTSNPASATPNADEADTDWENTGSPAGAEGAESNAGWGGAPRWTGGSATAGAQAWLTQLQAIVDNLATQSAPVIREVGAKAAEIAALAAERAGPLAQRAAEATAQASVRVAERSRTLAAEWRRPPADPGSPDSDAGSAAAEDSPGPASSDEDTTAPTGPTI